MPVYLYRMKLGFLMGETLLVITHRGRKSGALFQTPVEVVYHDLDTREYFVWSGGGPESNWYRNILAEPAVAIQVRSRSWVPRQRLLDNEEAVSRFAEYEQRRPKFARRLIKSHGSDESVSVDRTVMAGTLPMVAFSDNGPAF